MKKFALIVSLVMFPALALADMPELTPEQLKWGAENSDGDELLNAVDECPDYWGKKSNKGCPKDKIFLDPDGDNVIGADDKCPLQPGPASNKGCHPAITPPPDDPAKSPPAQAQPAPESSEGEGEGEESPPDPAEHVAAQGASPASPSAPFCQGGDTGKRGNCDGDPLLNGIDDCVYKPEDLDGFQDDDGCPDFDNDNDKIVDITDRCPLKPETFNDFEDEDGCPDVNPERPSEVVFCNGRIVPKEKILFDFNSHEIRPDAMPALLGVAKAMRDHLGMKIEVQGHTDKQCHPDWCERVNGPLSKRRAEAARAFLNSRRVHLHRMKSRGYGSHNLVKHGDSEDDHRSNRRIEFKVLSGGPKRELAFVCGADVGYAVTREEPASVQPTVVEAKPCTQKRHARCPHTCSGGCVEFLCPGSEPTAACDGAQGPAGPQGPGGAGSPTVTVEGTIMPEDIQKLGGLPPALDRAADQVEKATKELKRHRRTTVPVHFLGTSTYLPHRHAIWSGLGAGVHLPIDVHYLTLDSWVGLGTSVRAGINEEAEQNPFSVGSILAGGSVRFLIERTWGPTAEVSVDFGSPDHDGVVLVAPGLGVNGVLYTWKDTGFNLTGSVLASWEQRTELDDLSGSGIAARLAVEYHPF